MNTGTEHLLNWYLFIAVHAILRWYPICVLPVIYLSLSQLQVNDNNLFVEQKDVLCNCSIHTFLLLQHIQRQRGNLRVAVLVNDFAEVDIDSFLLDQSQTNAALGIPSVRLASGKNGGCFGLESEKVSVARQEFSSAGCACCTIRGKFSDAIKAIKASSHNFDHLIVEVRSLVIASHKSMIKNIIDVSIWMVILTYVWNPFCWGCRLAIRNIIDVSILVCFLGCGWKSCFQLCILYILFSLEHFGKDGRRDSSGWQLWKFKAASRIEGTL